MVLCVDTLRSIMECRIIDQLDYIIILNENMSRVHMFLLQIIRYFEPISSVSFVVTTYLSWNLIERLFLLSLGYNYLSNTLEIS
jgi:hypothetical protein